MENVFHIGICTTSESSGWTGLIPILEEILPVKFAQPARRIPAGARAGEVVMECVGAAGTGSTGSSFSSPEPLTAPGAENQELLEIDLCFADDPQVPFPFGGRTLKVKSVMAPAVLAPGQNEKVLARTSHGPVWTMSEHGGKRSYRCGFALPRVSSEFTLKDVFNETRFLEVLPLVHWLREISGSNSHQGPVPRACFVFDDPNLHWPRYGFVDYQELARQAASNNYHVAFATIPLDGWFTHPVAANVFRNNRSFLSLAIHGNDHTKQELARRYSEAERVALLRQAIRRIEQIERKAGLQICRVMVPPHGACAEAILELLPMCGFEAACLSHGSLRAHNREKPWTRILGYSPSEVVQGCPVLPRWGLSGNIENAILLASYLRQPVILRGHHQDLKSGVEVLNQLAGFINGLGSTRWSNLTDLSRANYEWRMAGTVCHLRPLGRRMDFQVPDGTTKLIIVDSRSAVSPVWQVSGLSPEGLSVRVGQEIAIPGGFKGVVSLSTSAPVRALPPEKRNGRLPTAAFVRRLLTEARDRLVISN